LNVPDIPTIFPSVSAILPLVKLDLPKDREFDAGVWYSTPASTWYPTHCHDELELKFVLWGHAVYQVGPRRIALGPGSQLWLAPGQQHTLVQLSDDLAMWVSSFRQDAVHHAELQSGVRILDRACTWGACVLAPARLHELSRLCSELVIHEDPREFNPLSRGLLVLALATWQEHEKTICRADAQPLSQSYDLHPSVARATALLRGPDGDLTLECLARRCWLSGPRLSRLFKQQMGLSLVQYRNHYRVQQFITQFGHGEGQTMLQVALGVGFGSYPQFHRVFRQVTGYAPSEHLRRVRAGVVAPYPPGAAHLAVG
jgi:AraC-like DNA-binding protein